MKKERVVGAGGYLRLQVSKVIKGLMHHSDPIRGEGELLDDLLLRKL
jgi:hypothetical protein